MKLLLALICISLFAIVQAQDKLPANPADDEIRKMVDSLQFIQADTLNCNAGLFWRIVAKKRDAMPWLIAKLNDTTATKIRFHCKAGKLNVAEVAYFALEQITSLPIFVITQTQFDVSIDGCWNFYDSFFDNSYKGGFRQMTEKWYSANKSKLKARKIPLKKRTACQLEYGIDTNYEWVE